MARNSRLSGKEEAEVEAAHESIGKGLFTELPVHFYMLMFHLDLHHYVWVHVDDMAAACVFVMVMYVTMVYGPIAAFLVELFPTKIRYTSMSLPYHIGNGVFGGLTPLIGTSIVAQTGNIYAGLFYPMSIAAMTLVVGGLFLPETYRQSIWREVDAPGAPAAPAEPTGPTGPTVARP